MKNKILAKCTAKVTPLKDRKDRMAEYVEIHLMDTEPSTPKEVEIMTRNIAESGLKAVVIHSPMDRKYILESFGNKEANERMHLVSKLAQNMHELNGEEIVVVIHQELSMEQLKDFGMIKRITGLMAELLKAYPNVKFAIENLQLIGIEGGQLISSGGFYDTPVKIAQYLRNKLNTDRIGTVLDTCHALSSVRIVKSLKEFNYYSDLCLEQYLEEYSDTLFLVHLSNAFNIGFDMDHGRGFDSEEDIILLRNILTKICDIGYQGPITLETLENDPDKEAPMYSLLKVGIDSILKEYRL